MKSVTKYVGLALVIVMAMLSSCVTSKKVNLLQEPGKNHIPEYVDTMAYEDYNVRIGDRLFIRVHSVDEQVQKLFTAAIGNQSNMNYRNNGASNGYSNELYSYLVLEDGTIDFPLIGKIEVRGLTTRGIKLKMEDELATFIKDYGDYKMVSVDVNVVQRMYSVISEGGTGNFSIRHEKLTIYEALAQAGDVGDWSDRSKVKIIREVEGQTKVISFDLRSKDIINSEFYYIEPNDVIYVQHLRGKAFGVSNAATTVAIVATTLSFGGFVYAIVQRIINASKK